MKTKLNLFCVCVLIALLLSTSTTVSIMFHSFTSAFKAGYESVEKGKDIHISDYKMICTLPTDLLEKTGSVTNAIAKRGQGAMVDCQASATPKKTSKGVRQPNLLRGL